MVTERMKPEDEVRFSRELSVLLGEGPKALTAFLDRWSLEGEDRFKISEMAAMVMLTMACAARQAVTGGSYDEVAEDMIEVISAGLRKVAEDSKRGEIERAGTPPGGLDW